MTASEKLLERDGWVDYVYLGVTQKTITEIRTPRWGEMHTPRSNKRLPT